MAALRFLTQCVKTSHARNKQSFGNALCLQGGGPLQKEDIGFWSQPSSKCKVRAPSALSKHTQAHSVTQKASDWAEHRCHLFWVWFQCQAARRGCFSVSAESIVGEKAEGNLNYHSFSLTCTFFFFFFTPSCKVPLTVARTWLVSCNPNSWRQ